MGFNSIFFFGNLKKNNLKRNEMTIMDYKFTIKKAQ